MLFLNTGYRTILFSMSIIIIVGCSHQSLERSPSAMPEPPVQYTESGYVQIEMSGWIYLSQTSRNAVDDDDNFYNLKLDCDQNQIKSRPDRVVSFSLDQVTKNNKDIFIARVKEQQKQHTKNTAPYIRARMSVLQNPCETNNTVLGYNLQIIN